MKILEDFKLEKAVPEEIINEYSSILPEDVISFWREYGFGSFLNGFLKSVNPEDYKEVLKESVVERFKGAVVLFATGMSDLIIWDNGHLRFCSYRYGIMDTLITKFSLLLRCLEDEMFLSEKIFIKPYLEAIQKYGELQYDEGFGYVPLLALGGAESVDNLDKVKIREHILIFSSLVGKISYA